MVTGTEQTFGPAVVLLGVVLLAWLSAWRRPLPEPFLRAHPAVVVATAAALARLVPTLALDRALPYDIEAHYWIGVLAQRGQDVYAAPAAQGRYPYPPLHSRLSEFLVVLAGDDRARFLIVDKALPALCGIAVALAVWAAAQRLGRDDETALRCGLLYALNPLAVLVTAYHGQFEEIPLLGIALAFLALLGRRPRGMWALSALSLGMAVAYKTWPLLFVPPLLLSVPGWWRRLFYAPLALLPLALSVLWYERAVRWPAFLAELDRLRAGGGAPLQRVLAVVRSDEVLHRIAGYQGSSGFCWGYVSVVHACWVHPARLRPNAWVVALNGTLLLAALLLAGVLLLLRRRPLDGMAVFPLAFLLFTPGWGPNYTVWALPFVLLLGLRPGGAYTLLLPVVALTYLDALYAAYAHVAFSWAVLKPAEAGLGLAAWVGLLILLARLSLPIRLRVTGRTQRVDIPPPAVAHVLPGQVDPVGAEVEG